MALKIIPATEPLPVETLVLTIYGPPGTGKSSLAFTAGNILLIDADRGAYRAQNRGNVATAYQWIDISSITAEDIAPYSAIALDTAGRTLDLLTVDILKGNPKLSQGNGALSQRGYGELKSSFQQWLSRVRSLGKDVILICHMTEEYKGDDIIERIDAQGSSKNEIYKVSDAMCRIQVNPDGSRVLNFDPREGGYGKNPAQLPRVPFPHPSQAPDTLSKVIAQIKASLNRMTEQQAEAVKASDEWKTAVDEAKCAEDINLLVALAKDRKVKAAQKAQLAHRAKELGLAFDKASGLYTLVVPSPFAEVNP